MFSTQIYEDYLVKKIQNCCPFFVCAKAYQVFASTKAFQVYFVHAVEVAWCSLDTPTFEKEKNCVLGWTYLVLFC